MVKPPEPVRRSPVSYGRGRRRSGWVVSIIKNNLANKKTQVSTMRCWALLKDLLLFASEASSEGLRNDIFTAGIDHVPVDSNADGGLRPEVEFIPHRGPEELGDNL